VGARAVSGSPIQALFAAFDELDIDGVAALIAPDAELLLADGRRATGRDAARELLQSFAAQLRSTSHKITAQWHLDNVWIAEVEASYELQDWLQLKSLPRAFIAYEGPDGISELHVYGAHERPLTEHRTGGEGMWIGDRWIPPL
jgi:hypothetical protein